MALESALRSNLSSRTSLLETQFDLVFGSNIKTNITSNSTAKSGYELPIVGLRLSEGQFLSLHIPAIVCILCGLVGSGIVIYRSSFSNFSRNRKRFFKRSKSERFVIYIALCDACFNVFHLMDHIHVIITRYHVHPKYLCVFYAATILEFICAQLLMVNIVAINIFVLIYFGKDINFGRYDWRILLWMFGFPFLIVILAISLDILGPNGMFCFFDGIKGRIYDAFFVSLPIVAIIIFNIVLYSLTWQKIRNVEMNFKSVCGRKTSTVRKSEQAVKKMSLFVLVFFIQWIPCAVYCVWYSIARDVPMLLIQFGTTFTNIGGVLNAIVYFFIRPKSNARDNSEITRKNVVSKAGSTGNHVFSTKSY